MEREGYKICFECDTTKTIENYYNIETDFFCKNCWNQKFGVRNTGFQYISGKTKRCTHCKETKLLNDFHLSKTNSSWCKKCHSLETMKTRAKNPEKYKKYYKETITRPSLIYARKKANAKLKKIEFTITKGEFLDWYTKQELVCHYCSINPKDYKQTSDKLLLRKTNLAIDRTDNDLGYTLENITLCCDRCNLIKNKYFTYEDMKFIGAVIVRKKWLQKGIKCPEIPL